MKKNSGQKYSALMKNFCPSRNMIIDSQTSILNSITGLKSHCQGLIKDLWALSFFRYSGSEQQWWPKESKFTSHVLPLQKLLHTKVFWYLSFILKICLLGISKMVWVNWWVTIYCTTIFSEKLITRIYKDILSISEISKPFSFGLKRFNM